MSNNIVKNDHECINTFMKLTSPASWWTSVATLHNSPENMLHRLMNEGDAARQGDRFFIDEAGAVFSWDFLGYVFMTEFQVDPMRPSVTPVIIRTPEYSRQPPEFILRGFCQFLHILAGDIANASPTTTMVELAKGNVWASDSRVDVYHALASLFLTHGRLLAFNATDDSSETGYLLTIFNSQGHIRTFEEFIKTEGQRIQAMSRVLSHVSDSIINRTIKN